MVFEFAGGVVYHAGSVDVRRRFESQQAFDLLLIFEKS